MTDPLPWYHKGLRFKCTQCGKCCTGAPGYVWITLKEVEEMAHFLHMTPELFMRNYVRRVGKRWALIEKKGNYDCIFLKDKQCHVYAARPQQCRKFPFWKENLSSPQRWKETAQYCEGIDHPNAELIPWNSIEK